MSKATETKISSAIYERLDALKLSPADRELALNAMENAEIMVDAFSWLAQKIEQLGAALFLRPSVKH